ncbi:MAG: threonine--tRNA ligase [Rickettsiaceae bacterium]|nr:threonine--tRNA ligase [Rickettsiaceae bacterium]
MINITFPDNSVRQFEANSTGMQIASSISTSLAKNALFVKLNGDDYDITRPINQDCNLKIITTKDPEALEFIRHDTAHILAEAIKELYPLAQITIGPSIENGFYYDISYEKPISSDDLYKIEKKMREIIAKNEPFIREEWDRNEAIKYFKSIGELYKAEIIQDLPESEPITIYRQGKFLDLCRGPHAPSTGYLKHFKLMKVAGAYWRGNSQNEMLQRIYGTAFATEEQLKNYLFMIEEAEKRDHRKLGKELDLFHFQEEAQGMAFWHHKGWTIYRLLETYIRKKLEKSDYKEVKTPMLLDRSLWEASGHWQMYAENMFTSTVDEKALALKPMNCPCHVQIFKQGIKSYRDLPIRMAEFGACHRNEASGALHGLMRVRSFVQDDAHIFCTPEQINDETVKFCQLLTEVYNDLGFTEIKIRFSDRPQVRAGSDEVWDEAEDALKKAVESAGYSYVLNPGEGAFYGPKLEFVLTDAIGREWQCGTLQVDFVLPERLDANYIDQSGAKKRPVILHRAIIGTFERFLGIFIENTSGKFPLWLAPVQVGIATVTTVVNNYAIKVKEKLESSNIRCELDISNEKINYKIREMSCQKFPFIVVIGDREAKTGILSIRPFGSTENIQMSVDELAHRIKSETDKYFN